MRKDFRLLLFLVLFICIGCQTMGGQTEVKDSDKGSVTPIEELVDTEHFRSGALEHILQGEVNGNHQAVGFHYERLPDANGQVINGTESPEDDHGVYEAKVVVDDIEKESNQGKSTFFPEEWDSQDVIDAINAAYEHRAHINGNTYEGLTKEGMVVRMYLDNEAKIISAFPQYEGGRS